jgi:hypothetical protein
MNRRRSILCASTFLALASVAFVPAARADYAVLATGARLHVTSYQQDGSIVHLHIEGGSIDLPTSDVVRFEPEEVFTPIAAAPRSAAQLDSSVPYSQLISKAAAKYSLDAQLLARVVQAESDFNPRAISIKNAQGLMQLMPQTSSQLAVRNPFDPAQSIDAGARYLRQLLDKFSGNVELALAAYNAGPDRVTQYNGIPPYRETQNYVRKITKPQPKKVSGSAKSAAASTLAATPAPLLSIQNE